MALPIKNRIKKSADFQSGFKGGRTSRGRLMFLKTKPRLRGPARFGFVVPSAVFKKAVRRNRIKRILAQAAQEHLATLHAPADILVVLTKGARDASDPLLREEFGQLLAQATEK